MISNSNSCFLIVGNCHFGCLHLIFEFSTLIIGLQVKISANPDSVMSYCTLFRSHEMHDCAISVPSIMHLVLCNFYAGQNCLGNPFFFLLMQYDLPISHF